MTADPRGRDIDLHAMIHELVAVHRHDEPYVPDRHSAGPRFVAHHRTKVPALIDQLLEPAPGGKGELGGSEAQARPAVRVEAHDTIELIATEAGEWIDRLGAVIPASSIVPQVGRRHARLAAVRGSAAKRTLVVLRTLHAGLSGDDRCDRTYGARIEVEDPEVDDEAGGAFEMTDELGLDSKDSLLGSPEPRPTRRVWCCTAHHVEHDVRGWWRQARIIAGWDSPTYRPFATCPSCSKRAGLRINLTSHTAVCVECRTVWGPESIGVLAEHIRRENGLDEDDLEEGDETGQSVPETA